MVFDYLISDGYKTRAEEKRAEHATIDSLTPEIDHFILGDPVKLVILRADALVQSLENDQKNAPAERQAELDYLISTHRAQSYVFKSIGTKLLEHQEVQEAYFDILKPKIPAINQHRDPFLLRIFNKIILTIGDALTNKHFSKNREKENKPPIYSDDTTTCYRLKNKHRIVGELPEAIEKAPSHNPNAKPQKPLSAYEQIISKL
jgi:hypothetical protein